MKWRLATIAGFSVLMASTSLALAQAPMRTQLESPQVDERNYVGNIYGTVQGSASAKPIAGARIYVYDPEVIWKAAREERSGAGKASLNADAFAHPLYIAATDGQGRFLISGVATPFPFKPYTVVAIATGYSIEILDRVPLFPGASMALEIHFQLDRGSELPMLYHADDPAAPFLYRNERQVYAHPFGQSVQQILQESFPEHAPSFEAAVFATREGLVGGTTANGHVITPNDHFVALPSRRALCTNSGHEFEVEVSVGDRTITAPQWDLGPWNLRDDYWNPAAVREKFQDLPQGMPEAQAAFQNQYNNGMDGGDTTAGPRLVRNPAGIDLADGTFSQDLQLQDNQFISVKFLWLVSYSLSGLTGQSLSSEDTAAGTRTGSALLTAKNASAPPVFFLLTRANSAGDIVSETSVAAAPPMHRGILSVDQSADTTTAISLVNPTAQPVSVTLSLLGLDGKSLGEQGTESVAAKTVTLSAWAQQVVQVSDLISAPLNPADFHGVMTVRSAAVVSAIGLQTTLNARGDPITTTVPVADTGHVGNREILRTAKQAGSSEAFPPSGRMENAALILPAVKDGAGFSTTFRIVNPSALPIAGTLAFFDNSGNPMALAPTTSPQTQMRFELNPNAAWEETSPGLSASLRSGYAVVIPDAGSALPTAETFMVSRSAGVVISQVAAPAQRLDTGFVVYVDRRPSRNTVVSLVNPSANTAQVRIHLTSLDGAETFGAETLSLAPQARREINTGDHFSNLPNNFEGILEVDSNTPITVGALHATTNSRGETVFSSAPVSVLNSGSSGQEAPTSSVLPYLEDGNGRQTQLVILNANPQQSAAGAVNLFTSSGATLNLNFK